MLSFLFWNIGRQNLASMIVELALKEEVDIIMLAESSINPSELIYYLNENNDFQFEHSKFGCQKIDVYLRFPQEYFLPIYETDSIVSSP